MTTAGPWLTPHEGQLYVGCKSIKSFWQWRRRHGIIARSNGTVAKRDLDRALRVPRKRHTPSPASLANLSKRKVA